MKALSIRQPWAWLIVEGHKDIKNRTWRTRFRGRILIHASSIASTSDYLDAVATISTISLAIKLPPLKELQRGGTVGEVDIVDCVDESNSPWFFGKYGFVLKNPQNPAL